MSNNRLSVCAANAKRNEYMKCLKGVEHLNKQIVTMYINSVWHLAIGVTDDADRVGVVDHAGELERGGRAVRHARLGAVELWYEVGRRTDEKVAARLRLEDARRDETTVHARDEYRLGRRFVENLAEHGHKFALHRPIVGKHALQYFTHTFTCHRHFLCILFY